MHWTSIRGSSLERTPWRNGRGSSRPIVTRLGRDGDLLWQVGLADLLEDAPFSAYPQHERVFTPLDGTVELAFEEGPFEPCPLLVPRRFLGETPVRCRVPSPGHAFNVITDRQRHGAEVRVLRLEAGDPVEAPEAPEVVIYCVEGELAAVGDLIEPGDALLGPGPAAPGAAAQDSTIILVAIRGTGLA